MSLANQLTGLKLALMDEQRQRMEVEATPAYIEKQEQIETSRTYLEGLIEEQKALSKDVHDSTEEYEAVKRMVLGEMREKGLEMLGNIKAKWRVSKVINTRKLMHFLEGDLDNFFLLAKVSQKDLKDFEKENIDYKGATKDCIEEKGRELTDIIVELPE